MNLGDNEETRKVFSSNLQRLRMERNITQKQLAEMLRTSTSTVAMWESAKRETNFATLCIIADVFGVTIDYLLGRSAEVPRTDKLIMQNGVAIGYVVLY